MSQPHQPILRDREHPTPTAELQGTSTKEVALLASGLLVLVVGIGGVLMFTENHIDQDQPSKPVDSREMTQGFHASAIASEPSSPAEGAQPAVLSVSPPRGLPSPAPALQTIETDVYFALGQARLSDDAKALLQETFHNLPQEDHWRVLVQGHTDRRGSAAYNLTLSRLRAESVKAFMITLGIPPDRIEVQGLGEDEWVCRVKTEDCERENRRAHLVWTPVKGPMSASQSPTGETKAPSHEGSAVTLASQPTPLEKGDGIETVQLSESTEEITLPDPIASVPTP